MLIKPRSRRSASNDMEEALGAAFRTGDQRLICCTVDVAVHRYGISDAARDAKIDRTSLHRAFRLMNGPALSTMIKMLCVLGFRLIVVPKTQSSDRAPKSKLQAARSTACALTEAFRSGRLDAATRALGIALRSQQNVSEIARNTVRSREALYKAFSHPRDPRFFTVLSFLNAIDLCFGVARISPEINRRPLKRAARYGPPNVQHQK